MKISITLLTIFFSITSFAQTFQSTMIGRVTLQKNQTITCLGTQCPSSEAYFQLVLDDVQIENAGPVETVVFQDFERISATSKKPTDFVYSGVTLVEGMYIMVTADVRLNQVGERTFALAADPVEIKQIPVRHPEMLF